MNPGSPPPASSSRAELDDAVLAWIRGGVFQPRDDARFGALALELFAHQRATNAPYARLCGSRRDVREPLEHWTEIPLTPTTAFKQARLACFAPERTRKVFRTSGTTVAARGELHLDTLELYEASLRQTFTAFVCPDLEPGQRMRFAVLAPDPDAAPDSSLSHMFGVAVNDLGTSASRFWLEPGEGGEPTRGLAPLIAELAALREPVALVGTAFAFVHLLDTLAAGDGELTLPNGSRVMETGGFKGRSRELTREELHAAIAARLGVSRDRIINQYGMCELATQYYEPSLRHGRVVESKVIPPWARVRALDPETLKEVAPGELGVLAHYDLANTGSVLAVLTADLGRTHANQLEIIGRVSGSEARGCSLAADAWLGG